MAVTIRALDNADVDKIAEFSVRAWAPVFESFEKVLGAEIYRRVYPDWLDSQARDVARSCRDHAGTTWVAVDDGEPVGFVTIIFSADGSSADIEMIAVDPTRQREGIGTALMDYSEERMRASGARIAGVVTGGDPGHEPARRAYEAAGFTALPLVRYYKAL
ncbi:GNAT family N-acetyltransferase [Actinoplanes sp. NPDC051633]|uniref:GNAT family N-acetyltransferase n=1 Tax=Actinoplanes sp. NPDC051633 TaxID=3155670 RepID=UPI003434F457